MDIIKVQIKKSAIFDFTKYYKHFKTGMNENENYFI